MTHDAEHASRTTPFNIGIVIMLRVSRRSRASRVYSWPATILHVGVTRHFVCVAVAVGAFLFVPAALAVGPPQIEHVELRPELIHSTRAAIAVRLEPGGLPTEWVGEYAPAEEDGEAPPENSPAWVIVNQATVGQVGEKGSFELSIGTLEGSGGEASYLRHLVPATSYFVRFIAKNTEGAATETASFKTLPVGKPEVRTYYEDDKVRGSTPWFRGGAQSPTTASFEAKVEDNGAETTYHLEYSLPEGGHAPAAESSSWKPFTSGATGVITTAEEYGTVKARVAGLAPDATYYVRLRASNREGESIQTKFVGAQGEVSTFTMFTAEPEAAMPVVRNITADSAHVSAQISPHESKTETRLEVAPSPGGPWTPVATTGGFVSQEEAERMPYGEGVFVDARLGGLSASTEYYARAVAKNECLEDCGEVVSAIASFRTSGAPTVTTFATHGMHEEAPRLLGMVNPNSPLTSEEQTITVEGSPTSGSFTLAFAGETSEPIAYNASAEAVRRALVNLAASPTVYVEGPPGGPYTIFFGGANVVRAQQSLLEADALGLMPSGTVTVSESQRGGEGYDTHYRFQYVGQKAFAERGWAGAGETPEVDAGSGNSGVFVGYDLAGVVPGETYRYRLVASNTAPGTSLETSLEQLLTVPVPSSDGETGACPNEAFRTGLSAHLPDCRAYEQLTPVDKEGAQEPFHYRGGPVSWVVVGEGNDQEGGEGVALESPGVNWGSGPGSGLSPYLFSRVAGDGWSMSSGSPEPQTGVYTNPPELYSADLSRIAVRSAYSTSSSSHSPSVEYKLGPTGGPYTTVASVPRRYAEADAAGWVAGNGSLSNTVLSSEDRTLLGEGATGTRSGYDLYEYTAEGGLRQLNVSGDERATIGVCGAKMVHGYEQGGQLHRFSSAGSISSDGARVFFEAAPGRNCSEPPNLYMRVDGTETVDIGAYRFLAASASGSALLLERRSGETGEVISYEMESAVPTPLFTVRSPITTDQLVVSSDLSALYFAADEQLTPDAPPAIDIYRYDISAKRLQFVDQATTPSNFQMSTSFGGEYVYFTATSVGGLPGGGLDAEGKETGQVYRYDNTEGAIECVSCASAFDPQPKRLATINGIEGIPDLNGGRPEYTAVSANGDFAFFTTPAALVPQDVDGELEIEGNSQGGEYIDTSQTTSPSSDIYEWRRNGVDGCGHLDGCLALITDGRGGYKNLLLGTADEGRDVFIYSRSRLLPQDDDTSGDVYDARIGGGFPPSSSGPVECEADACSSPPSAPNDATPSSSTVTGSGNVTTNPTQTTVKAATSKPKPKKKQKAKKRGVKKHGKRQGRRKRGKRGARAGAALAAERAGERVGRVK